MGALPLKYVFLVMYSQRFAFAMFSEEARHHRWSIETFHFNEQFEFETGPLSRSNPPIPSIRYIDIASIPQDHANQAVEFDHRSTAHVAVVTIEAFEDREDGIPLNEKVKNAESVLRSIIYNGVIPTASMSYLSTPGRKLDNGQTVLNVFGMAFEFNNSQFSPTQLSLIYPLPINNYTSSISFVLPSVKVGNIVVESLRKQFHVFDYVHVPGNSSISYDEQHSNYSDWIPELSSRHVMAFATSNDNIIYTFDEFDSIYHQKVLSRAEKLQNCTNVPPMIIEFEKYVVHLSEAGIHVLQDNSNGKWTVEQEFLILGSGSRCMKKAKVSPVSYSVPVAVALNETEVFVLLMDKDAATLQIQELRGIDSTSLCTHLLVPSGSCQIVDVAFDTASCCAVFVLVFNWSNSTYMLVKHSDILSNGDWSTLATFSHMLSLSDGGKVVVDLNSNSSSSDSEKNFTINGISTLSRPDGVIYMWGDVLIVFDIESSRLGWIPRFMSNATGYRDAAIQFNSAYGKGFYSILTKNGIIWTGISHPFDRPYDWVVKRLQVPFRSTVLSTFFDGHDKLYALVFSKNGSKTILRRKEVQVAGQSDSNCVNTYNCQKLFLLCDARYSRLHRNHSSFSRTRQFFLKPPVLTQKGKSDGYIRLLYHKKALITYLSVVERFFSYKKISVPIWWLSDERKHLLFNWWYTNDAALKQHRKYLHFKNSLPDQPLVYLHEGLFKQDTADVSKIYEQWQNSLCLLPKVIYLDKDEKFCFTIVLEHQLSAHRLNYDLLRLVTMQSDKSRVKMEVVRFVDSFDVQYQITLIAQQTVHKPPGVLLHTVAFSFYPWNPHMFLEKQENASCCWEADEGMAFEKDLLVKVGCPVGRRLKFDSSRSMKLLQSRGRTTTHECFTSYSDLPCFTTSEFAATFYIEDLISGGVKPFEGNYTLTIVGGGVGFLENVVTYSASDIALYNYKPGVSHDYLIWNVFSESWLKDMQDKTTGNLIFDAKNPASIVFECRLDSPCGSIPLGSANPAEYYFEIEVSNKGIDSSTNCDYTTRFMIRLIGIKLSARIHLYLMLSALGVILFSLVLYYVCNFFGGYIRLKGIDFTKERFEDDTSEYEEPPRDIRNALARRRKTLVGLTPMSPRSTRRASLLNQALHADSEGRLSREHRFETNKSTTSTASKSLFQKA